MMAEMMEYILFTSTIESLEKESGKRIPEELLSESWKKEDLSFDRFYFGQEFCERLIPSKSDLKRALEIAGKRGVKLTLVTPFVTDKGLEQWSSRIDEFAEADPEGEIVINDLGIYHYIKEKHPKLRTVLGRLLTKQKRGPRILRLEGKVPDEMIEHFRRFNADVPDLAAFYKELGFERIELDNSLQGIKRDNDTPASLYFPYIYVSTTRMCLTNQSDDRRENMRAIFPCKRECRKVHFNITHDEIPTEVILAGNTQFVLNNKLPENPEKVYVNRLIYEPSIPM